MSAEGETLNFAAAASNVRGVATDHVRRTYRMLAETFGVTFALVLLTAWAHGATNSGMVWWSAVPSGVWIQRHYAVGHEAAHGKLFPGQPWANAFWGQLALLALFTPLPVFRKIHQFHHGNNRRDEHTSALEVVCVSRDSLTRRVYAWARWLFLVFAGGWFWHGLASILLFLLLPVSIAEKISPAFRGWSRTERLSSLGAFAIAIGIHLACWLVMGSAGWFALCGAPLVVFAWVYSLHLYVYHYDMSIGPEVTGNSRCLGGYLVGWWILNLNEHATHHKRPAIVWYRLRAATRAGVYVEAQPRRSLFWGITNQLRGPRLVVPSRRLNGGNA